MMWPFWKMKNGDSGVYQIITYAGYNDDPADKKHVPIAILKSLNGYLNEAVPIMTIADFFDQVFEEEAPEAFEAYREQKAKKGSE